MGDGPFERFFGLKHFGICCTHMDRGAFAYVALNCQGCSLVFALNWTMVRLSFCFVLFFSFCIQMDHGPFEPFALTFKRVYLLLHSNASWSVGVFCC